MASYLSSLKVIEISSVLAGPAVGLYFAEKGAEVIKIENSKTGGDVTRGWKLANEDSSKNTSAYFASVNWRKEHVFLDLSDDNDRSKIKALVTKADIVLTNFKKGDAEKFELDFLSLRTLNSNVILGEISGYGSKSERVAFDLVLQADTGFMSMNGTSNSGPVKMPVAFIDLFAAHQLKEGILEALLERNATGKAYHVKVSLFDAALASLANQATNYLIAGHVAQPMGSKHPNIAPYGELFKTKDERLITFAIGSDKQFEILNSYLNLKLHEDFSSNQLRVNNREVIEGALRDQVAQLLSSDLEKDLIGLRVPVAIVKSIDEVLETKEAQSLMLQDELGRRIKTAVYSLESA
jgi:crotonobetainyl-CoA:carnitine CoA-transferase CaiB-like acyl-CoA transferase